MASPFQFGKIVSGDHFINRKDEIRRIQNNIGAGINSIIMSPRRWGKSSLMKQLGAINKEKDIHYVYLNLFNIRSEDDFYNHYIEAVLGSVISKRKDLFKAGKDYFNKTLPSFSFGVNPESDFSVSLNWSDAKNTKDEIINLPENVALKKRIKIVICIDEFQNIAKLPNHSQIEQELLSYWQHHQNTVYCLYGSRKTKMLDIFKAKTSPFYRFGDLIMLEQIATSQWKKYIHKSFKRANKELSEETIDRLISLAGNHPDYIQQLAHHLYTNSEDLVGKKDLNRAMELLLRSNKQYYSDICENLSNTQVSLIQAILNGEKKLTSAAVMNKYHLGTPRNVSKNKQMLQSKEIIELHEGEIVFSDPVFKFWFEETYL